VVTFTRVAPFVATLASAMLLDGVALLVLDGMSVTIGDRMSALGNDEVAGVPYLTVVAVLVLALIGVTMRFTTFGRDAFAMGGNEHVARLSGIDVNWRKLALYALAGVLAGLAGLMLLSRLGAAAPNTAGLQTQLTAVAAVVIGGTSLAGGH
ncbi:ABC transporter permease, partial [Streptomyces sp. TRM76130]|nr:ABC transporter permease [Streptomyces sp. TRM76130]